MKRKRKNGRIDEIKIPDKMLCSLVELLEKGIHSKIRMGKQNQKRLEKFKELADFDDLLD